MEKRKESLKNSNASDNKPIPEMLREASRACSKK
jgi:hypothetical protein